MQVATCIRLTRPICFDSTNLVMGRVRTWTHEKDSDWGFFAGLELRLGLAGGKICWTRTQVQHQRTRIWT